MKWAFSDESRRGGTYVVAAVIVETHEVVRARATLRQFLRSNQRRVHMTKESSARRKQFLAIVEQTVTAVAVIVPIGAGTMDQARARGLRAMTGLLVDLDVRMWNLEWMIEPVQDRDRQVIAAAVATHDPQPDLRYDHRPPYDEPLLWAADAVRVGRVSTSLGVGDYDELGLNARHPASHRPEASPGALPTPTGMSAPVCTLFALGSIPIWVGRAPAAGAPGVRRLPDIRPVQHLDVADDVVDDVEHHHAAARQPRRCGASRDRAMRPWAAH